MIKSSLVVRCLLLLFLWLFSSPLFADQRLNAISVKGLVKTDPQVVLRYLELETGKTYSESEITAGVQRVKNSHLFSQVSYEIRDNNFQINLEEKWSLIPIVKGGGVSGTTYYVLGVYDPNVAGKNLELGGQYENLGGADSGVIWFRKPYFSEPRLRWGGDFWSVMRNRSFYDRDRKEVGAWTLDRERQHLFVDWEPFENFRPQVAIDLQKDRLSERKLNPAMKELNRVSGFSASREDEFRIVRLGALFGKVNFDEELAEGQSVELVQESLYEVLTDSHTGRFKLEALFLKTLPHRSNLAYRFQAAATNTDRASQKLFLGGIDHLRGYLDSQVSTNSYLLQNLEYRFYVWQGKHSRLQQVVFTDSSLFTVSDKQESVISMGLGWRWIFPKIYRLNIRLDYGVARGYAGGEAAAFGLQQFF